jgi:hypothetical protein
MKRMNAEEVDRDGFALLAGFMPAADAGALRALYGDDALFRSRIVMARHNFGRGEYKYFADPLPAGIAQLRETLYRELVPIANRWAERFHEEPYPASLAAFLERCVAANQRRPTALMLRYGPGDYNCLHQDVYGPVAFPLQATLYLSRPGEDFGGGEVVLAEQRPRAQTRAHVLSPSQGDLLILPTRAVPRRGTRGSYRAAFKHGVSTVRWGERYALGIIFHDAL